MTPIQHRQDFCICRYLDLSRFLLLVARGKLWFSKLEHYVNEGGDPYEAHVVPALKDIPKNPSPSKNFSELINNAGEERRVSAPERLFVSCWCMDETENMAMWEICGDSGRGVCIRSTRNALCEAIGVPPGNCHDSDSEIRMRPVEYVSNFASPDLEPDEHWTDKTSTFSVAFRKRPCFRYENEWRIAYYKALKWEPGFEQHVDTNKFIHEVITGPRSWEYITPMLKGLLPIYGLTAPVNRSKLLDDPRR